MTTETTRPSRAERRGATGVVASVHDVEHLDLAPLPDRDDDAAG